MPCINCHRTYTALMPCERSDVSMQERLPNNPEEREWLVHLYYKLMDNCPCKECIVRMKCNVHAHECSNYFYHIHGQCKRV